MKPTRIDIHQSAYDHIFNVAVFFGKDLQTFRCVPEEITRTNSQVWGVYHTNGGNRNERAGSFREPLPGKHGEGVELVYSSGVLAAVEIAMKIMHMQWQQERSNTGERKA